MQGIDICSPLLTPFCAVLLTQWRTDVCQVFYLFIFFFMKLMSCSLRLRHSRFRGSYVVQGLKSIGEKDVIFHQGLHNVSKSHKK